MDLRQLILKKIEELRKRNPDLVRWWPKEYDFAFLTDEQLVHQFEWLIVRAYRQR